MKWHKGEGVPIVEPVGISYSWSEMAIPHLENANRHQRRAEYWEAQGKPEYATGSRLKAQRNRRRYREFDMWRHGALPELEDQGLLHRYIKRAEKALSDSMDRALMGGDGLTGLGAAVPIVRAGACGVEATVKQSGLPVVLTRQLRRQAERILAKAKSKGEA